MSQPKKSLEVTKIANDVLSKIKDSINKTKQTIINKNINNGDQPNTYRNSPIMRKALAGFMIVVMIGIGYTGYSINEVRTRAFDVYLGEENLGAIRTEEEALIVFNEVRQDLCDKYDVDIVLDSDLTFEPTHARDNDLVNMDSLKKEINSNVGYLVSGYAINVDGQEIAVFRSEEEVNSLLDRLKEPYLNKIEDQDRLNGVNLVEDVQILRKEVSINSLSDEDQVLEYIIDGGEEIKTHIVEVGESFWTIAKIYETSVDELVLANDDKDPTKLKPGDEVNLLLPTSVITVETVEETEYTEPINYDIQVEYDDSMYKNQKKVKVEGIKGEAKIVANQIRHNGILVDQVVVKEEVLSDVTDQIEIRGTKEIPKTMATGTFQMPTRGRISSRYGQRWGRMHYGLDIAASYGSKIESADAGTISFSGYKGSFGYMVEIDHGNGYKTRYAHASKLHVKKGDKVYKGQHIANVGNSGRSTGPHLHFEVLKNGVNQNPSNFVR